jgi:hypothetical protein
MSKALNKSLWFFIFIRICGVNYMKFCIIGSFLEKRHNAVAPTYYCDTLAFFRHNRQDIVKNLKLTAKELGEDVIGMVQGFGVFRYDTPPTPAEVGRAL